MIINRGLQKGTLIKRYKRFLADITTEAGETITIHCPNTGAMTNCQVPGSTVWYSVSDNLKRKYPNTWEVVQTPDGATIGVNTGLSNRLVKEAISTGVLTELSGYEKLRSEVKYGEQNSRIDLLLESSMQQSSNCYVEVKNVSLCVEGGNGIFPDAKTIRGQKHLQELTLMKREGLRAALVYCVQHSEIETVSPADKIDPEYGRLLRVAAEAGVEMIAYRAEFDLESASIELKKRLPVLL